MLVINSPIVVKEKIITSITRELGLELQKYLDTELGEGTYKWYWSDDDPAITNENGKMVLKFPAIMLSKPEIKNYRILQEYEQVIKDIDKVNLTAKSFLPSKPVKLSYELRVMTKNPDNEESFMLALERISNELHLLYPIVSKEPECRYRVPIWWGAGKQYSYDTEMTTKVYPITVLTNIESRKFTKVRLVSPSDSVSYTTSQMYSDISRREYRLAYDASIGSTVVYVDRSCKGLPLSGTLLFENGAELVSFIGRSLNCFTLETPLENYQLANTAVVVSSG